MSQWPIDLSYVKQLWYFRFFFELNCRCCVVFIVFSCLPISKIACLPVPSIAIFFHLWLIYLFIDRLLLSLIPSDVNEQEEAGGLGGGGVAVGRADDEGYDADAGEEFNAGEVVAGEADAVEVAAGEVDAGEVDAGEEVESSEGEEDVGRRRPARGRRAGRGAGRGGAGRGGGGRVVVVVVLVRVVVVVVVVVLLGVVVVPLVLEAVVLECPNNRRSRVTTTQITMPMSYRHSLHIAPLVSTSPGLFYGVPWPQLLSFSSCFLLLSWFLLLQSILIHTVTSTSLMVTIIVKPSQMVAGRTPLLRKSSSWLGSISILVW